MAERLGHWPTVSSLACSSQLALSTYFNQRRFFCTGVTYVDGGQFVYKYFIKAYKRDLISESLSSTKTAGGIRPCGYTCCDVFP